MRKNLKIMVLTLLISISGIITFCWVMHHIEKKIFENGAVNYLSQKYNENMIVIKTKKYIKDGWITYVYPQSIPELKFEIGYSRKNSINAYYDTYLDEYLKNDIYIEIKKIISDAPVKNIYIALDNLGPDINNLIYQKYKDMKRPASWKDIGISPQIATLKIYFSVIPEEEKVFDIVRKISELQYDIQILGLYKYEDEKPILLYTFYDNEIREMLMKQRNGSLVP